MRRLRLATRLAGMVRIDDMTSVALFGDRELKTLNIVGLAPPLRPVGLALGKGTSALEIAVVTCADKPTTAELRDAWKKRWGKRASPVIVFAAYGDRAAFCGPSEPDPPVRFDIPLQRAIALCQAALDEPDRHAARKLLLGEFRTLDAPIGGLRNEGLLATHHLAQNVPARKDWSTASGKAGPARGLRDEALLRALGFHIEHQSGPGLVLRDGDSKVALAVLVTRGTDLDAPHAAFHGRSPVSYGINRAEEESLRYVLVLEGPTLRLYVTSPGVGVGRRGRTETFVEVRLDLMPVDRVGYLWLLFSAEALRRGGTVEELLRQSQDYAADLGARLRERVYADVVPLLAMGVAEAMQVRNEAGHLRETYEVTLTILFRLLFLAYGEDRLLLPYESNDNYRRRSLKSKAKELVSLATQYPDGKEPWDDQPTLWNEVLALFDAVDKGKKQWGVPAYNGGLFSSDRDVSKVGEVIHGLSLPDAIMGRVLQGLLLDEAPDGEGLGPVDFRSLGVREFGTIYEGLLESDLAIAESDLTTDKDGLYRPLKKPSDTLQVKKGAPYLRNRSGARKASGAYFTKPFIVDHLLDEALEPALADHLARLADLDDAGAASRFFDFRVVDLSMGSGHFLVGAVDRIERALARVLATRTLASVTDELSRLRTKAREESQNAGASGDVEDSQLLRRQIVRRCIYGVDINPMSVELARLSLWIHTFVPGLPLSFLDHNLVTGNSLVGIATLDEASEALGGSAAEGATLSLFGGEVRRMLERASEELERLGRVSDADRAEIQSARNAAEAARKKVEPLRAAFDFVTAKRIDADLATEFGSLENLAADKLLEALAQPARHARAKQVLAAIPPMHFPIAFPEVFLRDRSGFDVILGNPPWEELRLERDRFWGRHIPGLQGLPQGEQEKLIKKAQRSRDDLVREYELECQTTDTLRRVIVASGYAGMNTGDPDLYKAFIWRFWNLAVPNGGRIGVVLPRTAFQTMGGAEFRRELFARGEFADLTCVLNAGGWVFDDAEHRYTIALTSLRRTSQPSDVVPLRGPYTSFERFSARTPDDGARFRKAEVVSWTDSAALPLLPTEISSRVFVLLRRSPRLDRNVLGEWRARPYREFHATDDKLGKKGNVIDVSSLACPQGFWPVYKGESFDLWQPDTGSYYGWADPEIAIPKLEQRRLASLRTKDAPFAEFGRVDNLGKLECTCARIAFRDVSRATDTRTVRAALLPPDVFLTNKAPYFLWPRGDEHDQAYLLGVLCSRPLDWYARRFVEVSLNYHILNPFPVPRPPRTSKLWRRVVALAGRLACPDQRFEKFAAAISVEPGPLAQDEKTDMIHELDAVVAHLYGLDVDQLRHVFETFHEGWDFEDDLRATQKHFGLWKKKGAT